MLTKGLGGSSISDNRKRNLLFVAVAVVALAALALFFRDRLRAFDWSQFWGLYTRLHPGWMALSLALALSTFFGRTIRWSVMLEPLLARPPFWPILSSTTIGFTAIVLFGRPGELVRPYLISEKVGVPFSSQMAAWFLERIYDLLIVLLITGIALAQLHHSAISVGPTVGWILQAGGNLVLITSAVALIILLMARNFSTTFATRLSDALKFLPEHTHEKVNHFVHTFVDGMGCLRNWSAVFRMVLYTGLEWLVIVMSVFSLFRAIPETAALGWMDTFAFVGFVAFGGVVQLPGVGGGQQVATVVILTELFHIALEPASAIAILIWLTTFVSVVPFGFLLAAVEGLQWSRLRHIEEQPELQTELREE